MFVPPHKTYKRIFISIFRFATPRHLYNNHQRAMLCTRSLSSCCPPAPSAMQKNTPCILCKYTRGQDLFKQKNLAPKGLSILRRYFAIYFLNRCTLKHKTPASKQPEFLFIAIFIFVHVPAFSAARTSAALRKPPRKTSLYPGSANMRQDHAPLQNPGNSPRADKPPNRQKNRNRRLL